MTVSCKKATFKIYCPASAPRISQGLLTQNSIQLNLSNYLRKRAIISVKIVLAKIFLLAKLAVAKEDTA